MIVKPSGFNHIRRRRTLTVQRKTVDIKILEANQVITDHKFTFLVVTSRNNQSRWGVDLTISMILYIFSTINNKLVIKYYRKYHYETNSMKLYLKLYIYNLYVHILNTKYIHIYQVYKIWTYFSLWTLRRYLINNFGHSVY